MEVLQSADQYLYKLKSGVLELVKLMQEEKEQEAILIIPEIADGIDWITKVIDLTKDVQKEHINLENINEHLETIIEALENQDYILVSDIFNYEIIPILDKIHDEIKIIIAN
ncbi:alkyl sulfatase BDS1-like metallo-beta-lactamase superfamily hydrolase [Clostridium beijerinckii]|nr:alkyl sulfatase BDS1-like metallo-beta-lactamase superfamily hydrolase [Clostridium beijerinckii]